MATNYAAKGTQLKMGDGQDPENFTPVAQMLDIAGPAAALDTVDVTNQSSVAKEFVATILDGGEITFSVNYDPAEATHKNAPGGLSYVMQQKLLKNWKIVFPDQGSSVISFSGYVVSFEPDAPVTGKLSAKLKIRVSGAVTLP